MLTDTQLFEIRRQYAYAYALRNLGRATFFKRRFRGCIPPDAVVFGDAAGDPVEGSDEFHDCSEGGDYDDIFKLLDRVLAIEGFVPGTP
jgi:hypothetical protein